MSHSRSISEVQLLSLHNSFGNTRISNKASTTEHPSPVEEVTLEDLFPPLGLSDYEEQEQQFVAKAERALNTLFDSARRNSVSSVASTSSYHSLPPSREGSAAGSPPAHHHQLYDNPHPLTPDLLHSEHIPISRSNSISSTTSLASTSTNYFSEGDNVEDSPLYSDGNYRGNRYFASSSDPRRGRAELMGERRTSETSSAESEGAIISYNNSPLTSPFSESLPSKPSSPRALSREFVPRTPSSRRTSPSGESTSSSTTGGHRKTSINLELLLLGSPAAGIDGRGIDGKMCRSTSTRSPETGFELSTVGSRLGSPIKECFELSEMGENEAELVCPLTPGLDDVISKRRDSEAGGYFF